MLTSFKQYLIKQIEKENTDNAQIECYRRLNDLITKEQKLNRTLEESLKVEEIEFKLSR